MTDAPDGRLSALARQGRALAERVPEPAALARVGLGATVLLAGAHKLVAPGAWAVYVVGWLEPFLVVSPRTFMLANGLPEVLVGGLLLADRLTAPAAAVVAVSLAGTVAYLGLAALTTGGFVDTLVRDVGLLGLALVVLVEAAR